MKTILTCPCGELIRGVDEDDLVAKAERHLADAHNRTYTREEILFIAI